MTIALAVIPECTLIGCESHHLPTAANFNESIQAVIGFLYGRSYVDFDYSFGKGLRGFLR